MPIETVRLQREIKKWTGWMTAILFVVAWGFPVSTAMAATNLKVTQVTWIAGSTEVVIKGSGAGSKKQILIFNDANGQQIGSTSSEDNGTFVFDKKGLKPTPCIYLIKGYDGRTLTAGYTSNPPAECNTPVPVTLSGFSVSGPTIVNENSSADYTATAIYSDGSSKNVTASTTWAENSSYASINSSGHLVTTAVTANQLLLVSGVFNGKSASVSVTIRDVPTPTPTPKPTPTPLSGTYKTFAFNNLGMHCYDPDFSVFSILPVFNVVNAQVIKQGTTPTIVGSTINLSYKAMADATGSINTTSIGKTDFWDYVLPLFGGLPALDEGLLGAKMPGSANQSQPFPWVGGAANWFEAAGIPITAFDDNQNINYYPLMNVQALDPANSTVLSSLPVVVPVSNEMACNVCHITGNTAARIPGVQWSQNGDSAIQFRENILILHDYRNGTNLNNSRPVLCASCHYSPALDLGKTGAMGSQVGRKTMSEVAHGYHASRITTLPPSGNACYYCHPGETTKCNRGAMTTAGLNCLDCHGNMTAVGQATRHSWADLPKCQSCHTGDAVNHLGTQIIGRRAFTDSPNTATPIVATNKRFAEQDNTLYRNSVGHNGVACESCHGSTHAEWPTSQANDNLAATSIQGHDGKITECTACHGAGQSLTKNGGPHGLHNVNSSTWISGHHDYASSQACGTCHGTTGAGTVLSKAAVNRSFSVEGRTVSIPKGTQINCSLCHENQI